MIENEKRFTGEFRCGHCQNNAPMEIVAHYAEDLSDPFPESYADSWRSITRDVAEIYQLCKCPACHRVTLRHCIWSDDIHPDEIEFHFLYPQTEKKLAGLPQDIETAYNAALQVRTISPNAYAVLLGRVLEMVCEDRSATGKNLYSKLSDLANKGEIPTKLVDVAQRLRDLRNVGAHATLGELTESEVPILDTLIKALLEYVYAAPQLVELADQRLRALQTKRKPA